MKRFGIGLLILIMIFSLCACGNRNHDEQESDLDGFVVEGNDAEGEVLRDEEDIGGKGLIAIDGVFMNTEFSTEYQHMIYVVFDLTNDTSSDLTLPTLDLEKGNGSPVTLQLGENGTTYEDMYPMNPWMREGVPEELLSTCNGDVIESGSNTVRMIACFQIDTQEITEDTPMILRFEVDGFDVSTVVSTEDIHRITSADRIAEILEN